MTSPLEAFRDRLAPGIAEYLIRGNAVFAHGAGEMTVAQQRALFREMCRMFAAPRPPGLTVRDEAVAAGARTVPVRLYRGQGEGAQPALLYFHGGGWVLGDLDSHDDICAELAHRAGVTVVAVDYRLSPEHVYPAALDDGWAVLKHVAARGTDWGIDPARLGIGGDSAGGTLAAALALRARDAGGPALAAQILIYPALGVDFDRPSYRDNAEAPGLTRADMKAYWRLYLGGPLSVAGGYAVPLLAGDMAGLPPAVLLAAEFDPLRDDAVEYARRLRDAGVPADLYIGEGLVHAVMRARHMSEGAARFFEAICDGMIRLLRG